MMLYLSLPFAPKVWKLVLPMIKPHGTAWFSVAGVLIVLALTVRTYRAGPVNRTGGLVVLGVLGFTYVLLLKTFYAGGAPAQKAHLILYGVLAYLAMNTVYQTGRFDPGIAIAVGYVIMVGLVDECIQGILPMRHFSWRDVAGNWVGALLGCLAWISASPCSPWRWEGEDKA
jgi:hypothetical protein